MRQAGLLKPRSGVDGGFAGFSHSEFRKYAAQAETSKAPIRIALHGNDTASRGPRLGSSKGIAGASLRLIHAASSRNSQARLKQQREAPLRQHAPVSSGIQPAMPRTALALNRRMRNHRPDPASPIGAGAQPIEANVQSALPHATARVAQLVVHPDLYSGKSCTEAEDVPATGAGEPGQ